MTTLPRSPCHHCLQAPATFFQLIGFAVISAGALPPASRSSCSSISQARASGKFFQQVAQGYGALIVTGLRQIQGHAAANLDILVEQ